MTDTDSPIVIVGIDLETTGFGRNDQAIEFGAAVFPPAGGAVKQFSMRTNPGFPISETSTRVHGIRDADVAGFPSPFVGAVHLHQWIISQVRAFKGQRVQFWAHNSAFDFRFLARAWDGWIWPLNDTLALARRCLPGLYSYKLADLCEYLHIPNSDHSAAGDSLSVVCLAQGLLSM